MPGNQDRMASSSRYFSFPFNTSAPSRSKQSRKRKRGAIEDGSAEVGSDQEDDDNDPASDGAVDAGYEEGSETESPVDEVAATPSTPAAGDGSKNATQEKRPSRRAVIHRDWEQNHLAGYNPSSDLPLPTRFPHQPLDRTPGPRWTWGHRAADDVAQGLAELSPPLGGPRGGTGRTSGSTAKASLRRHHLSVLTAVVHRCLLDGDYDRAGCAWALLLRSTINGKAPDLRGEGRWGIGAEVLLRQGEQSRHDSDTSSETSEDDEDHGKGSSKRSITIEGFDRGKEYYERLILNWPYHPQSASRTNALQLYPAFFALWIYATQQQQKMDAEREEGASEDDDDDTSARSGRSREEGRRRAIDEAEAIAARMDELMLSPPYADSIELWHLRGMVALWMADLFLPARPGGDEASDHEMLDGETTNPIQAQARRQEELARARTAFQRVRRAGGMVWEGVPASLQADDPQEDPA